MKLFSLNKRHFKKMFTTSLIATSLFTIGCNKASFDKNWSQGEKNIRTETWKIINTDFYVEGHPDFREMVWGLENLHQLAESTFQDLQSLHKDAQKGDTVIALVNEERQKLLSQSRRVQDFLDEKWDSLAKKNNILNAKQLKQEIQALHDLYKREINQNILEQINLEKQHQ